MYLKARAHRLNKIFLPSNETEMMQRNMHLFNRVVYSLFAYENVKRNKSIWRRYLYSIAVTQQTFRLVFYNQPFFFIFWNFSLFEHSGRFAFIVRLVSRARVDASSSRTSFSLGVQHLSKFQRLQLCWMAEITCKQVMSDISIRVAVEWGELAHVK